jgi:protein-S-isoprenylcysteine O-methyltransferase Ste14
MQQVKLSYINSSFPFRLRASLHRTQAVLIKFMSNRSGCLKFFGVLLILALLAGVLYPLILRPWHLSWGTAPEEGQARLPGDEYVPQPDRANTRAITIHAPVERVWPWLIQLGADRGGLYSYTWLEALINCPIHNADRIHPEWQTRSPGDQFPLCPGEFGPPPYEVISVIPGEALILGHRPVSESEQMLPGDWFETWTFVLKPVDQDSTRLYIRTRTASLLGWMQALDPGVFVMERGLMIGLKARAEGSSLDPSAEALFKLVFGALLLFYLLIRFLPQAAKRSTPTSASASQGRPSFKERVLVWSGWLVMVPILIYPFFSWLDFLHLYMPTWLRWIGALIFLGGDLLFFWTRRSLGEAWSSAEGVAPHSSIVTAGPYRWIRHPMYAAMFLITSGMFLLSANPLVGLPYLVLVLYMYITWIEIEEADLINRFGEPYTSYIQRSGRLFPRWRK